MARTYTYREHGTQNLIKSDKPLTGSPNGNDVTLISAGNEYDETKYESAEEEAAAKAALAPK